MQQQGSEMLYTDCRNFAVINDVEPIRWQGNHHLLDIIRLQIML